MPVSALSSCLFLNIFNRNEPRSSQCGLKLAWPLSIPLVPWSTFAISGNVNWLYGLILAVGTSVGAWTASRFSVDRGEGFIKLVMILMVAV